MNDLFSPQEIKDLLERVGSGTLTIGGKKIRRRTMYVAKDVSALNGTFQFLLQSTNKAVGITNFDGGNKLNGDRRLIVLGSRLKVDVATGTPTAAVYKGEPTAALKNGEIRVIQGEVLFDEPVSRLYNPGVPTKNDDDFFRCAPFYIKPNSEFKIEAEVSAAIGNTTAVRLEFDVLEFVG